MSWQSLQETILLCLALECSSSSPSFSVIDRMTDLFPLWPPYPFHSHLFLSSASFRVVPTHSALFPVTSPCQSSLCGSPFLPLSPATVASPLCSLSVCSLSSLPLWMSAVVSYNSNYPDMSVGTFILLSCLLRSHPSATF